MKIKNAKVVTEESVKAKEAQYTSQCDCSPQVKGDCDCACATV